MITISRGHSRYDERLSKLLAKFENNAYKNGRSNDPVERWNQIKRGLASLRNHSGNHNKISTNYRELHNSKIKEVNISNVNTTHNGRLVEIGKFSGKMSNNISEKNSDMNSINRNFSSSSDKSHRKLIKISSNNKILSDNNIHNKKKISHHTTHSLNHTANLEVIKSHNDKKVFSSSKIVTASTDKMRKLKENTTHKLEHKIEHKKITIHSRRHSRLGFNHNFALNNREKPNIIEIKNDSAQKNANSLKTSINKIELMLKNVNDIYI